MDVVSIHYNTPELMEAAIRSVNRVTSGCKVYVFDNSDERPFRSRLHNVSVIDNTRGRYLDFERLLLHFPDKVDNRSNWGSAKHCMSVDFCFDLFPNGFVLMDSDVLVKRDIGELHDDGFAWVGGIHTNTRKRFGLDIFRVIPYLCYVNVPLLREYGIRYFNPDKMWFLCSKSPNMYYDTGAWLLEECTRKGLQGKTVNLDEYAIHFRHGSWKDKDAALWLESNKELWIY